MSKTTNVELVQELTERNIEGKYDKIIERAKENGYHDFKMDDEKYDSICGKMDLVSHLSIFPELEDIRQGVINGDYDESPDSDDIAELEKYFPGLTKQ